MEIREISHSQNFLRNPAFVGSLIEKTNIGKADLVIEIGPGKGIITSELSKRANRILGIEIDPILAKDLKVNFSNRENVEIIQADFLKWELPNTSYKVFANIPFNMTADILNKLFLAVNPPTATYLIMQDLAAAKFIGRPSGPVSQTSILLQPFYNMAVITHIDRKEFYPIPHVNIVLAKFERREMPMIDFHDQSLYRDFVVYGYNQWQPTLLKSFKGIFTDKQLDIMATSLRIRKLKPSELTVQQWIEVFRTFMKFVPDDKKIIVKGAERRLRSQQKGIQKRHRTSKGGIS